jgi:hypothetical protein
MKNTTFVVAVIAGVAASSTGQIVFESEPNDVIAQANFAGAIDIPGGSIAIDGRMTSGDVDWFQVDLNGFATLLLGATGSASANADAQLMVVDGTGTDVLAFDDDSGVGTLPALQLVDLSAGTYYVGVSAFDDIVFSDDPVNTDTLFDGLNNSGNPHNGEFEYKLVIAANLIPTPGALAILGLGGLAATRRKR